MNNTYISQMSVSGETSDGENGCSCSDDMSRGGFSVVKHGAFRIACLTVIGQIEGHSKLPPDSKTTCYEHLIPLLLSAECSDETDGVLVILNTVGGDVEAGLALAELIAGMKKPVVSLVLGGAHSIGIPLAVAADVSLVAKTATLTVHPVRINGLVLAVPQSFDVLRDMQDRIIGFVCENSHISPARFRELMFNSCELATDIGTVLGGEDAVNEGLLDKIATLSDAFTELENLIIEKKRD